MRASIRTAPQRLRAPPNPIWHNREVGTQVSPEDFGNDVGAPPVSCTAALGDDTGVEAVGVLSEGPSNGVNSQPASPAATWLATPPDAHVCQMQDGKAGAEAILNGQMQERFLCFTYVRTYRGTYVRTAPLFHLRTYVLFHFRAHWVAVRPALVHSTYERTCVRTHIRSFVRTSVSVTYVRTYVSEFGTSPGASGSIRTYHTYVRTYTS